MHTLGARPVLFEQDVADLDEFGIDLPGELAGDELALSPVVLVILVRG
jgi:hypothetical protein